MLSRHTLITEYERAGRLHFVVVGWPGYAGALSGMAPGRFSITLNAVLSEDPAELAPPMTFLIRDVLDTAANFDEAVVRLRDTPVTSDSLLLVTGTMPGEMVVIERSPKRAAVRHPENGVLVVTNDYRALVSDIGTAANHTLAETSCGRFERAFELARDCRADDPDGAFEVLEDAQVRMNITVQSMVLSAATALIDVRLPREPKQRGEE